MLKRWVIPLAALLALAGTTALLIGERDKARIHPDGSQIVVKATPVESMPGESGSELQPTGLRQGAGASSDAAPRTKEPIVTERHRQRASSFFALLQSYDTTDQELLRRFDRRYHGALQFQSEEQLQWMSERGYPMPEDILEARTLSDEELRIAARGGEEKYLFLYADRVFQGLIATKRQYLSSGLDPDEVNEYPEFTRQSVEAMRISSELLQSDSPFAGYVMAQLHWITTGDPFAQLAALHLTISRGDFRAHRIAENLIREAGLPPEVGEALSAYAALMWRTSTETSDVIPFGP